MEMERGEKEITEQDSSVTSEKQNALADKNEMKVDKEPSKATASAAEQDADQASVEIQQDSDSGNLSAKPEEENSDHNNLPQAAVAEVSLEQEESATAPLKAENTEDSSVADDSEQPPVKKKTKAPAEKKSAKKSTAETKSDSATKAKPASKKKKVNPEEATLITPDAANKEKSNADDKENIDSAAEETADNQEEAEIDYTSLTKEELVELIKKLGKEENPFKADKVLVKIAPLFNKIRKKEKSESLKKFISEGGQVDDFSYQPSELDLRFDANYKLIKDKKSKKFKEQDIERAKNLVLAEEVLEELRVFVDSEESSNSFNHFKTIQQKWKNIGDVPSQNSRTLWANYNALVHRFYDQRSIYFELKELDRRKNYELKEVLCEKAEALAEEKNLRVAIKSLNDLHKEYKHMGPVPQELQEELWQRFKLASDKVYEKRKSFVSELKAELHENLVKKQALLEQLKAFTSFDSDRIKDWNSKTKELLQLQKTWDSLGGLPKERAKQINKDFWSSFKTFFANKHRFFKKLDADREINQEKKQALIEKAIALQASENWEETSNEFKRLQNEWREIGPVPEKLRNKLYADFKAACDQFFDNRRAGQKNSLEVFKENLKLKREIIEEIKGLMPEADKNIEQFNALRNKFGEIGFVPKKNIGSLKEEFQKVIESFLANTSNLSHDQKTEISLETEFSNLAGSEHSEKELYHKEQAVRRHINKLEDDIALWRNNLEFFARSKSADKLRLEVNKKIDAADEELAGLKRQLKMLRSL